MDYLITGGAGFIGSHLIERLLQQQEQVVCLDNFNDYYDPAVKWHNIAGAQQQPNFRLIAGDILDEALLARIFQQHHFDVIVHLAARAGVRPSVQQPQLYQEVNIRGTLNLLEMARQHRVNKFIFASSSSVYGNNQKVPFAESDPVDNPISPYAATKKAGELICYTYSSLYSIGVSCLRFFTVYGPRQRPDMAIHKFTRLIAAGEAIPIYGDGQSRRDFTYISDIIDGIVSAIEHCSGYDIFNLGESRVIALMDLIKLIEENLGRTAAINWLPPQLGDVAMTYADISRARTKLNYHPRVHIAEGIREFVRWFQVTQGIER